MVAVGLAALLAAGCGGDDEEEDKSKPPSVSEPYIDCGMSGDPNVNNVVVTEVGATVTDPDRDLKLEKGEISASLNGLPISMGDMDADRVFTWKPSMAENKILCDGRFDLVVRAADAEGHETTFEEKIQKSGAK